ALAATVAEGRHPSHGFRTGRPQRDGDPRRALSHEGPGPAPTDPFGFGPAASRFGLAAPFLDGSSRGHFDVPFDLSYFVRATRPGSAWPLRPRNRANGREFIELIDALYDHTDAVVDDAAKVETALGCFGNEMPEPIIVCRARHR